MPARSEKPIQYPVDVSDSFVSQALLSGHLSGRKAATPVPSLTVAGTWGVNMGGGGAWLLSAGLRSSRKTLPQARPGNQTSVSSLLVLNVTLMGHSAQAHAI